MTASPQAATLAAAIEAAFKAALPPSINTAQPTATATPVLSPTLFTVRGLVESEPALSLGGVRADLLHRRTNGLSETGAVIRRGRLLLLHRERYLAWLLARGEEKAA